MTAPAITLDPSQEAAVELVCSARFGVVTGGPGTGKTTCLRTALDRLDERGATYALAAPTGKAARRMREATGRVALTVHRLLEYGPLESGELGFRRNEHTPIFADLVVVDEASMLDVDLADSLTRAIDPGRTRLVLVGDADQLPSVGPGRVFGDLITSGTVPVARLTTLHRAAAETWVCSQAPVILGGNVPDLRPRPDFRWLANEDRGRAIDLLIGAVFRDLPALGVPAGDVQVLIPQRVGPAGCNAVNGRLQQLLNPERDSDPTAWKIGNAKGDGDARVLRLRDRVIQTRNDYTLGVANGEVGEVCSISNEPSVCEPCRGEGVHPVTGSTCDPCKGSGKRPPLLWVRFPDDAPGTERRIGYTKADVFALDLAYALTIHKSQGSQWPWVVVFAHSTHTHMLTRQLLYTGITRAQTGVVLVGDLAGLGRAVKETRDGRRNTWLAQELQAAGEAPHEDDRRSTPDAATVGEHHGAPGPEVDRIESPAAIGGAPGTNDEEPSSAELAELFPM